MDYFLKAVEIENFKPFGDLQRFPLGPLTLLYGQNSCGKSSFLHALLYLKELIETGEADLARTRLAGSVVDLGGFSQFVHGQDRSRTVIYRLIWDFENDQHVDWLRKLGSVVLELRIGFVPGGTSAPFLFSVRIESYRQILLSLKRGTAKSPFVLDSFDASHEFWDGLSAVNPLDEPWKWSTVSFASDFTGSLPANEDAPAEVGNRALVLVKSLEEKLRSYLASLVYIGPLRAHPGRYFAREGASVRHDSDYASSGRDAWDRLSSEPELRERVNDWMNRFGVSSRFQFDIRDWLRVENLDRLEHGDVEFLLRRIQAELEPSPDEPPTLEGFLEAARVQLSPYFEQLSGAIRGDKGSSSFPELLVRETGSRVTLSHRDVGTGYSQIVPVLIHALGDVDKTILIEQPELHIHPGLQCDLADLFLESHFSRGNMFVLETHSEHILLRILRRLREIHKHQDVKHDPEFKPEDIEVLFLKREGNRTTVERLRPRDDGRGFADGWPEGFFGERTEELFAS